MSKATNEHDIHDIRTLKRFASRFVMALFASSLVVLIVWIHDTLKIQFSDTGSLETITITISTITIVEFLRKISFSGMLICFFGSIFSIYIRDKELFASLFTIGIWMVLFGIGEILSNINP